jgi:hypothetical protein
MLEADSAFAERVQHYDEQFGAADADMLAVLAQAAYLCWFHCEHSNDLIETCRAIASGRPTSMHLCLQVTPKRWAEMNTYVVGVQRWLGVDLPLPRSVNRAKIDQIKRWLGDRDPAKDALAVLFLHHLIDQLLFRTSLSKLAAGTTQERVEYTSFTPWYFRPDGTTYATAQEDPFIGDCRRKIRQVMGSSSGDATRLISGIMVPRESIQPVCMHRFSRYLNIKLTSIGALGWRSNLPAGDFSKAKWKSSVSDAEAGLRSWAEGSSLDTELALSLGDALGKPDDRSRAVVLDFVLAEKTGSTDFYNWLQKKAQDDGTLAGVAFGVVEE